LKQSSRQNPGPRIDLDKKPMMKKRLHGWIQVLILLTLGLVSQAAQAQEPIQVYLSNFTNEDISMTNILLPGTSMEADVRLSYYDPDSDVPEIWLLKPPSLTPKGQFQVLKPFDTVLLEATHPAGHVSFHMLTQEGRSEPLYVKYSVVRGEGESKGLLEGFGSSKGAQPRKPFAILKNVSTNYLVVMPLP
jgi:hypothetical protein